MKNRSVQVLSNRLRTVRSLIHANKFFFYFLGLRKSLLLILGSVLFSLASTLNIVAFLPVFTFFTGTPEDFSAKYLLPIGIHLDSNQLAVIPFVVSVLVLVAFLLKFLFSVGFAYLCGKYSESYLNAIRLKLSAHAQTSQQNRQSINQNDFIHKLTIISRVGSLNWAFLNCLVRILFAVCSLVIIFKLDARGIIFLLFYGVLWTLGLIPIMKRTRESAERYLSSLKNVNRNLLEDFVGHESFKIFKKTKARSRNFTAISQRLVTDNGITSVLRQASASSQEVVIALALSVLVIFVSKESLQLDNLIAVGFLINRLSGALNEGVVYLSNSIEHLPAALELESNNLLLAHTNHVDNYEEEQNLILNNELSFNLTNFSPLALPITPVNLNLSLGDRLKIVGPNGVGKTTFMKSMMGLIPFRGEISVNGKPLTLHMLIPNLGIFAYVPQEPLIIQGSFLENIFLESNPSNACIEQLSKLESNLGISFDDFIPNWRHIKINEGGSNLSGGQKQLISIVRAITAQRPIILFDEFTNHLSDKLKSSFINYLNTQCSDKVLLYVSHDDGLRLNNEKILSISPQT